MRTARAAAAVVAAVVLWLEPAPVAAQTSETGRNDYSQADTWLCRPGKASDACAVDLTTTVVAADGAQSREMFAADPRAPIDCFYVYPTVSADRGAHSDMQAGPEEQNVVRQQFARFGSQCRTFAPLYRQVTLAGLRSTMASGARLTLDQGPGYQDVLDAWRYYLAHDNAGRGVVLIGHSQGAMVLTRLIAEEIDGKPMQSRLVSALLLGTTVPVAKGKTTGGAFQRVPLCRAAGETGCVITFATYRATSPPPANALFGRVADPSLEAGCTNPAALAGGSGPLRAYLTGRGSLIASAAPQTHEWVKGSAVETPFVSVPGMLTARCAANEHAHYLEITVAGDAADPRADDIPGDLGPPGKPVASWGLHLVDVNLTLGTLVELVAAQARAYQKTAAPRGAWHRRDNW